jgi:hypothetical protein
MRYRISVTALPTWGQSLTFQVPGSILYADVLERLEGDYQEMAMAARSLEPHGHLIVLSPAHQARLSEFDAAIGHYRRYNKAALVGRTPAECHLETVFHLDRVGMFASVANRTMLRQGTPTLAQIKVWETPHDLDFDSTGPTFSLLYRQEHYCGMEKRVKPQAIGAWVGERETVKQV